MPGTIIRALPKTTYDFSTLTQANQTMVLTVAKAIDVSAYREVNALVRIHSANFNNTPSFKVDFYPENPSPEDPSQDFIGNSLLTVNQAFSGLAVPYLNIQTIPTPYGGFLRIKLTGVQGGTASTTFNFAISIDINAKS
jgi:hypothetical protein